MESTKKANSLFILNKTKLIILFFIGGLFFKVSAFFSIPFSFFIVLTGNIIVLVVMYVLFKRIEMSYNNLSFNKTLKHKTNIYFKELIMRLIHSI